MASATPIFEKYDGFSEVHPFLLTASRAGDGHIRMNCLLLFRTELHIPPLANHSPFKTSHKIKYKKNNYQESMQEIPHSNDLITSFHHLLSPFESNSHGCCSIHLKGPVTVGAVTRCCIKEARLPSSQGHTIPHHPQCL